ncbi:facilitated trehalose transporter Tret1-2 homolog [Frankliniella occidentalis]|uniref:Facilitated trehalose transporter Tret1-2 homolog n=1 Tax=Frankliniella occidentalis TaxID=133901 RepID=A0A9C6XV65_FRAOC|nr:facilitated trehalose transporter Tret1-2 homolog [Frankliniella occidentalis]XP_052132043.1 facilitated trehalose transporter Tret1-2 homolog [Frankliniella occidentalis]
MSASSSSVRSAASQSLAALAVFLINITSGMGVGWSSPGWSKLTEPDAGGHAGPGFLLDLDEASWVVAIYDVGIPVGSVLAGVLLSSAGRRRTLMLAPLLVLCSSALTAAARSSAALNAARVLLGVSFGLDLSCSSLYIGEMASSDMRGKLCTFTTSLVFVGVLLEFAVGPYVSYFAQALLPVPFALLSLLLFLLWVPESPYFLATRGRAEDMRRALARLRGVRAGDRQAAVDREAEDILRAMEEDRRRTRALWRHLLSSAGSRRGCLIVLFLCGTGPMIGTGSLLSYAQYLFRTTGSALSAEMSAIIMCSVQVVAGVASSQVIDRAGRRPLLLVSALCNATAMAAAGAFFFLRDVLGEGDAAARLTWLPLASLMVFMVSTNLGTTTVPWVMIGELLPHQTKAFVPSLSVLGFSVVAFGTNKLLPVLGERVGLFLPFWLFGAWSIVVFFFTLFLVPETRGKTLLEVQAVLQGDKALPKDAAALDPEDGREPGRW